MNNYKKMGLATAMGLAALPNIFGQNTEFNGVIGRRLEDSTPDWPTLPKAPDGAPNVMWILLDDVGYGTITGVGGKVETPVMDSLFRTGLCYTNFHTCGISAPSRAALLTGRNHHTAHMGNFAHVVRAVGYPGYDGFIPSSCGTIAEVLRENGYNTFAIGKYGLTPDEEASDAGPFDHWPQGKGFEHFYGFIKSSTDNYNPALVDELTYVQPDGRHLEEQLADRAIAYIDRQKKAAPDKPFFMYYAPSATHSPHQAPREWLERYKGKFDEGWDAYRESVFAREKELGTIPANAVLPPRESHIPAWDSLDDIEKAVCARHMEAYAAFLSHSDYQLGRVIDHLREIGQLDNTIIITMVGDNGASKSGHMYGVFGKDPETQKALKFASNRESVLYSYEHLDLIGTPWCNSDFPLGWAQACNVPYQYWKGYADTEGGTRNPLIINWAGHIEHGIREQFCHINDIMPTTLEMVGVTMPEKIRNIDQVPLQGTSLVYSFDKPKAKERHTEQYFFIYSSRALYKDGWKISLEHPLNLFGDEKGLTDDDRQWRLYNLREDPTEMHDLSKKNPKKLQEMIERFEEVSHENNVFPYFRRVDLQNGNMERVKAMNKKELNKAKLMMGGPGDFTVTPVY